MSSSIVRLGAASGPSQQLLEEAIRLHDDQFGVVDLREKFEGSPHKGTQTIYLRSTPWPLRSKDDVQQSLQIVNWPVLQMETRFQQALPELERIAGLPLARAMVVRLEPGKQVEPHADQGRYAELTERFHYVVTTNDQSVLGVGDEHVSPKVGEIWWIDKRLEHWAYNNGPTPRIHLIFDGWRQ